MEKLKLVDKLREKTNLTYEEAKEALEKNNWDILEAMVYLEQLGRIENPQVSEFFTNIVEGNSAEGRGKELMKVTDFRGYNNSKGNYEFHGIFEAICKVIDTGNNIFLEVNRANSFIFKLPLTVMAVLVFFAFWAIIPLMLIALFLDVEFSLVSKRVHYNIIDKINKIFKELAEGAKDIKEKIIKHVKVEK